MAYANGPWSHAMSASEYARNVRGNERRDAKAPLIAADLTDSSHNAVSSIFSPDRDSANRSLRVCSSPQPGEWRQEIQCVGNW